MHKVGCITLIIRVNRAVLRLASKLNTELGHLTMSLLKILKRINNKKSQKVALAQVVERASCYKYSGPCPHVEMSFRETLNPKLFHLRVYAWGKFPTDANLFSMVQSHSHGYVSLTKTVNSFMIMIFLCKRPLCPPTDMNPCPNKETMRQLEVPCLQKIKLS